MKFRQKHFLNVSMATQKYPALKNANKSQLEKIMQHAKAMHDDDLKMACYVILREKENGD